MRLSLEYVIECIEGTLLNGSISGSIRGISTDSRRYEPDQLFFALQGEKFDGHDYVDAVIKSGAAAVVVSNPQKLDLSYKDSDTAVILVDDTEAALQRLASCYRCQFSIPIVAVTGSVGKTTTKDILAVCLSPEFVALKTPGNYNNEIGLPLTILSLEQHHQAAVVELAMRAPGQIRQLAGILRPTHAIITNVEPVHLETMGSLENIARAKCELLEFIAEDKFALINGDSQLLLEAANQYSCIKYTFGYSNSCDIQILGVNQASSGIHINLGLWGRPEDFYFPVPAPKLATNLASAIACAYLWGLSPEKINHGLRLYQSSDNRLNITNLAAGGTIINDTYNANPVSMVAALEVCHDISNGRKTAAVLGDMLELGDYEQEGHILVGRRAAQLNIDLLVTVGDRAAYIAQGALSSGLSPNRVVAFKEREEALNWIKSNIEQKDVVLFKGSRGMRLEELLQGWLGRT